MVWWLFATKPERVDTTEAADLHRSRLHSTRPQSLFGCGWPRCVFALKLLLHGQNGADRATWHSLCSRRLVNDEYSMNSLELPAAIAFSSIPKGLDHYANDSVTRENRNAKTQRRSAASRNQKDFVVE